MKYGTTEAKQNVKYITFYDVIHFNILSDLIITRSLEILKKFQIIQDQLILLHCSALLVCDPLNYRKQLKQFQEMEGV